MSNPSRLIAIGELARRTGMASSALRYYERAGLLSPTARAGGRRHYRSSSVERLALIQLCLTCPNFRITLEAYLDSRERPRHPADENTSPA